MGPAAVSLLSGVFSPVLSLPYARAENMAYSRNGAFHSAQVFIWLRQSITLPFTCQQFKVLI